MRSLLTSVLLVALAAVLPACSSLPFISSLGGAPSTAPSAPVGGETVWAVSADQMLVQFKASEPNRLLSRQALQGLPAGDEIVGIDFRVSRGLLYALGRSGRLYTLATDSARLNPVGNGLGIPLRGQHIGIDFNPAADRLRVVTDAGQNLRVHPDTGQAVDADPQIAGLQEDGTLTYLSGDRLAGQNPRVVAAGYTYHPRDDKLTTNYGLDLAAGMLVMQGSHEDERPAVSPNTGRLRSVGPLGVANLRGADLDISDVRNTALAALRTDLTRLYRIDLVTGRATLLGVIGSGVPLRAIAIEP